MPTHQSRRLRRSTVIVACLVGAILWIVYLQLSLLNTVDKLQVESDRQSAYEVDRCEAGNVFKQDLQHRVKELAVDLGASTADVKKAAKRFTYPHVDCSPGAISATTSTTSGH